MGAAFSVFTRVIGEDRASEIFRKVGSAAKGLVSPLNAVNAALDKPSTTALGRVGTAFDNVAGRARAGLGSLSAWLPALGAIGAAGSLAGLIGMTRRASEGYDGLAMSAQKLGVTKGDLAVWRYGAKLVNVESEALEKGLVKLNKAMYDAATGKNKDVAALFVRMKIPLRDGAGQVKNVSNSLEDIAEAFKNTGNPATQTAMAVALFGRAGADLLPFLTKGRAGIADLRAEMKKYSGLTDQHRSDFEHLDLAYKQLDKAGSGLASRLSAVVAPSLARVVDWTTAWIVANRELIAQALERKVEKIGRAFDLVARAGAAFLSLPFVEGMLRNVDAGDAFDIALAGLGLTMAGPVFAALQIVTKGIVAMNVALLTNPFVLVAAAVAAAAYAIYANWGPITGWFDEQMSAISTAFDKGFGSGLWEIFTRFNGFNLIAQAVNGLSKWLFDIDLFDAGARLVRRLIDGIKSLLPDLTPLLEPIDRAIAWADSKGLIGSNTTVPAGLQAMVPTGYGGGFPMASPPAPGSAAAIGAGGAPQKATIDATITVKAEPGTVAAVETASKGVDSLDVGRSMVSY